MERSNRMRVCSWRGLIYSVATFVTSLIVLELLDVINLQRSVEVFSVYGLVEIVMTALVPVVLIITALLVSYFSRSITAGLITLITLVIWVLEKGSLFFVSPGYRYTTIMLLLFLAFSAILFMITFVLSQFIGGYRDSLLWASRFRKRKTIATSLAIMAISVEVSYHLGLWKGTLLDLVAKSTSILVTLTAVMCMNSTPVALLASSLSGLGWPATFLSILLLSQQLRTFRPRGYPCFKSLKVVGVSERVPVSRSLLRPSAVRWTVRSFECTRPAELCISRGAEKTLIHAYGNSARRALANNLFDLDVNVICLECNVKLWRKIGEVLKVTPDNIDLLETRRPRVILVESPFDYLYSTVVSLSRSGGSREAVVLDGAESIFYNTKILRAVLTELLRSFNIVILISDSIDYYLISNHVFRFPNVDTVYMIGNVKNRRILKEVLSDYVDGYVMEELLDLLAKERSLVVFPVLDRAVLVTL